MEVSLSGVSVAVILEPELPVGVMLSWVIVAAGISTGILETKVLTGGIMEVWVVTAGGGSSVNSDRFARGETWLEVGLLDFFFIGVLMVRVLTGLVVGG